MRWSFRNRKDYKTNWVPGSISYFYATCKYLLLIFLVFAVHPKCLVTSKSDFSSLGKEFHAFQVNGVDLAEIEGGETAITNLHSCNGPDFVLQLKFFPKQGSGTTRSAGSNHSFFLSFWLLIYKWHVKKMPYIVFLEFIIEIGQVQSLLMKQMRALSAFIFPLRRYEACTNYILCMVESSEFI